MGSTEKYPLISMIMFFCFLFDPLTLKFDVFFWFSIVKKKPLYSDLYLIEFDNYSHQLPPNFGFKSQFSFQYMNNKFTVTVI